AITPPVALAVFAAAGLAKASMWQSGFEAVRMAAPAYIVPFMFVYEPSLLMIGPWNTILTSSVSAIVGVICLAGSLQGQLLREARLWERLALFAAAMCLIKPGLYTDSAGLALLAAVVLSQKFLAPARQAA
ncbi:MAG TPA: C4-dicarboxylate ABC transporter permease, partial [Myxococcota bacterium]|nr:C4-dicarboxylate ABC transporter permease [Myxococcota bacterium]